METVRGLVPGQLESRGPGAVGQMAGRPLPSSSAPILVPMATRGIEPGLSACKLAAEFSLAVAEPPHDATGAPGYRLVSNSLPYISGVWALRTSLTV
jgi:hypothetical protein